MVGGLPGGNAVILKSRDLARVVTSVEVHSEHLRDVSDITIA